MFYHVYPPTQRFAPFVTSFWLYHNADPQPPARLLPTGTAQIIIDLSGTGLTLPRPVAGHVPDSAATTRSRDACAAVLHGVDSIAFFHENDRPRYAFGVDFAPGGVSPFFAPPASDLHNLQVPLDALWGTSVVRELCERVATASTQEERAEIVEAILLRQLVRPPDHHPAVAAALRVLSLPSGRHVDAHLARIAWIAEEAGLSRGWLTRLFKEEVGLTPKHYARIRRFLHALRSTHTEQTTQRGFWTQLALDCGYYDQAHLIKDFQMFAGICPSAFLRARAARSSSSPTLRLPD